MKARRALLRCVHRLVSAAILGSLAVACLKGPRPPEPGAIRASQAEPAPNPPPAAAPTATEPEPRPQAAPAAVPMKAAEPPKVQAKPKVGPATSLGGADRHLVMRPFDARPAADFSIGPLVGAATDPGLLEALRALERGLREGELPLDRFSEGAAAISAVRFRESDLSGIRAIRFSIAGSTVRGTATVRVRALTEPGSTVSGSALGLAILTQNESGAWRIEHFELDTEALKLPSERKDPWDPYGVVFPSSTL